MSRPASAAKFETLHDELDAARRVSPTIPDRDAAEILPREAARKLIVLRVERDEALVAKRGCYQRRQEIDEQMRAVRGRIDALLAQGRKPEAAEILVEDQRLTSLVIDKREIELRMAAYANAAAPMSALIRRIEAYAEQVGRRTVDLAPTVSVSLKRKHAYGDAVDAVRARIEAAQERKQAALDAPIFAEAAKEIARQAIDELASKGKPDVLQTIEGRQPPGFPQLIYPERIQLHGRIGERQADRVDSLAFMVWCFKDKVLEAIEKQIEDSSDDASALNDEDRAAAIVAAERDQLAAEREEEVLIDLAAASGTKIARRANADLRAVLGLADNAPKPGASL